MSTVKQDIDQIANETANGGNTKTRVAGVIERVYNEPKVLAVETDYPTTIPLKAGQRFWYLGNEWHYMTQAEIDSSGWTGLVSVGFPAPVRKVYDFCILLPSNTVNFRIEETIIYSAIPFISRLSDGFYSTDLDFIGLGMPNRIRVVPVSIGFTGLTISGFKNAGLLKNIEDIGTIICLTLVGGGLTDLVINDFFNQLPTTVKTATIDVSGNPGSATCDPSIATSKGYTVIT
jgi:hypothetical protein